MNLSSNGVRMIRSNGVRLRLSSHPFKFTLDYGLSRVIEGGVGHGVNPNNRVRCLSQTSHNDSQTNPNSSEMKITSHRVSDADLGWCKTTSHKVSDADFFEHFESWCKKYGKTYSSEEEKLRRFNLFKDNYAVMVRDKNCLGLALVNENAADDNKRSPQPPDFKYPIPPLLDSLPPDKDNYIFKEPDKIYPGPVFLDGNADDDDNANKIVYTVVTGANKGLGLSSKGTIVVLAARDEERGLEALRN